MVKPFLQALKSGLKNVYDVILPRNCINCEIKLKKDEQYLCNSCFQKLILLKTHISDESISPDKYYTKAYSAFKYDDVSKECIHFFKYLSYTKMSDYLAYLAFDISGLELNTKYDYLIPVPLYKTRLRERGYNQAVLLANSFSKKLNIPVSTKIIYRSRHTDTQTQKSHEERKTNVKNAFKLHKTAEVKGKKFLLVDDVITTGSTMNSIAKLLKENKAKRIDLISFTWATTFTHQNHKNKS